MKKIYIYLFIFININLFAQPISISPEEQDIGGYKPDTVAYQEQLIKASKNKARAKSFAPAVTLPTAINLTQDYSSIMSAIKQKKDKGCVPYCITTAIWLQEAWQNKWTISQFKKEQYSYMDLYEYLVLKLPNKDKNYPLFKTDLNFTHALSKAAERGLNKCTVCYGIDNNCNEFDWDNPQKTDKVLQQGIDKIDAYTAIHKDDINAIKKRLYSQHPVIAGMKLNKEWLRADKSEWLSTGGKSFKDSTYHAVTIIGYDDTAFGRRGGFLIWNSIGVNDIVMMPYQDFKECAEEVYYIENKKNNASKKTKDIADGFCKGVLELPKKATQFSLTANIPEDIEVTMFCANQFLEVPLQKTTFDESKVVTAKLQLSPPIRTDYIGILYTKSILNFELLKQFLEKDDPRSVIVSDRIQRSLTNEEIKYSDFIKNLENTLKLQHLSLVTTTLSDEPEIVSLETLFELPETELLKDKVALLWIKVVAEE